MNIFQEKKLYLGENVLKQIKNITLTLSIPLCLN